LARDKRVWVICAAVAVAVIACISAMIPSRPTMRVTFFDVGDGLCMLIRTPSGKTLIMDCGTSSWRDSSSVGKKLVVPYLQSQGISSIDAVVLSHPHSDHLSGIPGLLRAEPTSLVMDSGQDKQSPEYIAFLSAVRRSHARYRKLRCGQTIDMGDGVMARVVGPPSDPENGDTNDNCVVLRVTFGRTAVVLEADAGDDEEAEIISSGANLRAQVLQVGHHGSARSTSPEWLSAVRPSVGVISCSNHSRYGFPSKKVLDRLASFGVRTYTTGESGAVTVTTDGSSVNVSTFRPIW
jgi:competence protein ComEC